MNMLNSVILEGVMLGEVSDAGLFHVKSERHSKVGETNVTTFVTVLCQIPEVMKESAKNFATDGSGIRIVGRLDTLYGGEVGIFVEHIEYKFPKKETTIREGKYNFKQD